MLANRKGQLLEQHLFAVGYLASEIMKQFDSGNLVEAVYVAGCLHDIGKIDTYFQKWVSGKETKQNPFNTKSRHNEISAMLYHLLRDDNYKKRNGVIKDHIEYVIYWHHSKLCRKTKKFNNYGGIWHGVEEPYALLPLFNEYIERVNAIGRVYFSDKTHRIEGFLSEINQDKKDSMHKQMIPDYKHYYDNKDWYNKAIRENANNNIARMVVIMADHLVSGIDKEQLSKHIQDKTLNYLIPIEVKNKILSQNIESCLKGFEANPDNKDRNKGQEIAAGTLAETEDVAVLNGSGGSGKTKVALEWALKTNVNKILWICPRVQVCQGLFNDLSSKEYLFDSKIEILTGDFKFISVQGLKQHTSKDDYFSGNIVITTVDQIINFVITHRKTTSLMMFMKSHVVFDEFHEYARMKSFNLLFYELIECKRRNDSDILLISATPNFCYLKKLLHIDMTDVVTIKSFNKRKFKVSFDIYNEYAFDESNPFYRTQPNNTFVISNTAKTAQLGFIHNQEKEDAIVYHSKFTCSDKEKVFNTIFDCWKEMGDGSLKVLRSGPIVQASLNLTCNKMITSFTDPENWMQRLGRLDRFGKNEKTNNYITAVPNTLGKKGLTGEFKFLSHLFSYKSAKAWYFFIKDKVDEEMEIKDIYKLYMDFYDDNKSKKMVEADMIRSLEDSAEALNRILNESIPSSSYVSPSDEFIIGQKSLRNKSRFVDMAMCSIKDDKVKYLEKYACSKFEDHITAPVRDIKGERYGKSDSSKDLLIFMKKHHYSMAKSPHLVGTNFKTKVPDYYLLNQAREYKNRIFLSYIKDDLIMAKTKSHKHSIYYAIGNKQVIGTISFQVLKQLKEKK